LFAQALAAEMVRRAELRGSRGRGTSTDAELWVEPESGTEVVDAMTEASQRLHAAARPPRSPGHHPHQHHHVAVRDGDGSMSIPESLSPLRDPVFRLFYLGRAVSMLGQLHGARWRWPSACST
jgi:hypothetical protein